MSGLDFNTKQEDTQLEKKTGHNRMGTASFKSSEMLESLETSNPSQIRTTPINLLDGTMWAVRYCYETDKIRHAMIRLKNTHGLQHDGAYSLFAVHDGLISGELMPIEDEMLLKDELQQWTGEQQRNDFLFDGGGKVRSKNLLIRRRVYFRESPETREAVLAENMQSMAHTMAFIDASYTFRRGWYHQNREQLIEAAALLYNALHIHTKSEKFDTDMCVSEIIPHVCLTSTPDAIEELLNDVHSRWKAGINKITGLQSEQVFCHKLSTWNPWYGSIVFPVSDTTNPLIFQYLAATQDGIYVLTRDKTNYIGAIAIDKFKAWSEVAGWEKDNIDNTIAINVVTNSNSESKNTGKSNEVDVWSYKVKAGNMVCIIDQFIEYSHGPLCTVSERE